jgi:hypothetical protein
MTLADDEFEAGVDSLVQNIRQVAHVVDAGADHAGDGAISRDELRGELARLRDELEGRGPSAEPAVDASASARVPAGVPELPMDYKETVAVAELRSFLLQGREQVGHQVRVGFFGMGGLGKTVTSCAIVRDESLRRKFGQLVWLPLGQNPVIEKLQRSCFRQLTGKELAADFSTSSMDDQAETMRLAFKKRLVLLVLDDLWELEHEAALAFVDPETDSRVLISTRVRGLLAGASAVELQAPSVAESVAILLAAAEYPAQQQPPPQVDEVVRHCNQLPLALVMAGRLVSQLGLGNGPDPPGAVTCPQRSL